MCDYEIEKYIVHYSKSENEDVKKRVFDEEETAIHFAKIKMDDGFFYVSIKQITNLTGWY